MPESLIAATRWVGDHPHLGTACVPIAAD